MSFRKLFPSEQTEAKARQGKAVELVRVVVHSGCTRASEMEEGDVDDVVRKEEIDFMLEQRGVELDLDQLRVDYGPEEVDGRIVPAFEKYALEEYLGVLMWPGCGSRWEIFLDWLGSNQHKIRGSEQRERLVNCFTLFANYLGRIESHRALALAPEQYRTIEENNSIWPSGRLKVSAEKLREIINELGVRRKCYARLYIGLGLYKYDGSLSLHDDGETAVCIASGYIAPEKRVYLMKMSVPLVHTIGYRVADISVSEEDTEDRWFEFNGIWFDESDPRTERYVFYEIPFYKENLVSLRVFNNATEIEAYLKPFREQQKLKRKRDLGL